MRVRFLAILVLIGASLAYTPPAAASDPPRQRWMHRDVPVAWGNGFTGQNTWITVIDDFDSGYRFRGNLERQRERLTHGEWVAKQASMVAFGASVTTIDYNSRNRVRLGTERLNIFNLSYAAEGPPRQADFRHDRTERDVIRFAQRGAAIAIQAAGNESQIVGRVWRDAETGRRMFDYLARDLIGAPGTIFVGALERHGTVSNPASLASYSARPGKSRSVQDAFLVVGVPANRMGGLAGTSFAAPVVSGYAAILGSKFPRATAVQVRNQLLDTARTDTIRAYDRTLHGRGEASLRRALAPRSIR
jgi:hypothetical protein